MAVEITMRQDAPGYKAHGTNKIATLMMKPVPFFEVSYSLLVVSNMSRT